MRVKLYLLSYLLWVVAISQSFGHDLEVDRVQLQELGPSEFELSFDIQRSQIDNYGVPTIPSHCTYLETPSLREGPHRLRFRAEGRSLADDDVIVLPWNRNGALVSVIWQDGTRVRQLFKKSDKGVVIELAELSAGSGSALGTMRRYFVLGVEHILEGYDHLLFVAGLALLVTGRRKLIATITAFTLAHSMTLGLAVLEVVHVNPTLVEVLIALSIAFLAKEVLLAQHGKITLAGRFPWLVSFGFGLIHGLGFAGALMELGMSNESIPLALLFFNIGVEIGQVLFLLVWLTIVALLMRAGLGRMKQLRPVPAYCLGIVAMFWFLERLLGFYDLQIQTMPQYLYHYATA